MGQQWLRRDIIREALGLKEVIENDKSKDKFSVIESKRPFDYTSNFLQEKKSDLYSYIHKMFEHVFFMFGYLGNMMVAQDILYGDAFVLPDFSKISSNQIAIQIVSNKDAFLRLGSITQLEVEAFGIELRKLMPRNPVKYIFLKDFYEQLKSVQVLDTRESRPGISMVEMEEIIHHVPNAKTKSERLASTVFKEEDFDLSWYNITDMIYGDSKSQKKKKQIATKFKVFMKRYKDDYEKDVAIFLKKHYRIS